LKTSFFERYLKGQRGVVLHEPKSQVELHHLLAYFDVGLALETGKDINNQLAISNKLMAYFQAGLFVLATNTKAQRSFMQEHCSHGLIISLSKAELINSLVELLKQKDQIRNERIKRYQQAGAFDSQIALQPLAQILQNNI